jgi:hypothetical protein
MDGVATRRDEGNAGTIGTVTSPPPNGDFPPVVYGSIASPDPWPPAYGNASPPPPPVIQESGARSTASRMYVWTAATAFAALWALNVYAWWPFYRQQGVQGAISAACAVILYGGWMALCLWAVSRLTRMLAGRGLTRAIVVCHVVALAFAALFTGALVAVIMQQARKSPTSYRGIEYATIGDGPYFIVWALITIVMYETFLVGCLLFLEAVAWLRGNRSGVRVATSPAPGTWPPAPAAPVVSPAPKAVAKAQRDSMGTSIGIVTGVAGLGLGFNGNYTTAAVSIGVGLVALVIVYVVGGRLRG